MTEKYAVLIKYKYLEYIDSAKLSDADAWIFLKGIIEYDKTGTEPIYSNPVLSGLFAVVKIDLDKNRENYEAILQERSEAGKKGAEKRWGKAKDNSKDSKSQKNMAKMANATVCQKNMAKMPDNDLDNDLENSTTIIADACASAIAANISNLQNECARLGFKISQQRIKTLLKDYVSGFKNPADTGVYETLYGPDGFTEFVSKYVHKKYESKSQEEKLKLFLSLMVSADLYNEYVGSNP
jgi:hypothetical protein